MTTENTEHLKWTGEFADSRMEARFRTASKADTARLTRNTCLVVALFNFLASVTDFEIHGFEWPALIPFTGRVITLLFGLWIVIAGRKRKNGHPGDVVVMAYKLTLFGAFLIITGVNLTGTALAHPVSMMMIVVGFFILLPTRITVDIAVNAVGSGVFFLIYYLTQPAAGQIMLDVTVLLLIVSNVLGAYLSRTLGASRRREFFKTIMAREAEEKYRLVVDNAAEAVVVIQSGVFRFANPMAGKITGLSPEQLAEAGFLDMVVAEDRVKVEDYHRRRLTGEEVPDRYQCRMMDGRGEIKWLEVSGVALEWEGRPASLNFITDITERKQIEEEGLIRAKLEATIETAGAACHELNQPLQAVFSLAEMALRDLPQGDPRRDVIERILTQAERMGEITGRLNRVTKYRTKKYVDRSRILDLDGSSD